MSPEIHKWDFETVLAVCEKADPLDLANRTDPAWILRASYGVKNRATAEGIARVFLAAYMLARPSEAEVYLRKQPAAIAAIASIVFPRIEWSAETWERVFRSKNKRTLEAAQHAISNPNLPVRCRRILAACSA